MKTRIFVFLLAFWLLTGTLQAYLGATYYTLTGSDANKYKVDSSVLDRPSESMNWWTALSTTLHNFGRIVAFIFIGLFVVGAPIWLASTITSFMVGCGVYLIVAIARGV